MSPPHGQGDRQAPPEEESGASGCRFLAALAIFAVANFVAWFFQFGRVPATAFPELTWTGWTIKDFLAGQQRPNLVFLGSSLVLVPVAGVDADYQGRRLDGSRHHTSVYLEKLFRERTGRGIKTYNFALPGEMPSDAYLITDFLLSRDKRPDLLVYGVGPRDFMDNVLPSPSSTDPFRNLARFGDLAPISSRMMPDWPDRLNFEIGRVVYLYGLKTDLTAGLARYLQKAIDASVPLPRGAEPVTTFVRRQLLPLYKPNELAVGEAFFRPTSAREKAQFSDNLAEYRKRYKRVKWDTFVTQMQFFADILDVARSRGTHVVVMMMPITDLNRSLIKDYAWDAYRGSVRALALAKGASLIDLAATGRFALSDFMDTVHLNAGGGRKMLDILGERLACDEAVRCALELPPLKGGPAAAPAVDRRRAVPLAGLEKGSLRAW